MVARIASINFFADTREALLELLIAGGFRVPANIGKDAESVVQLWANVRHRLLDNRKRSIHRSREFAGRKLGKPFVRVIEEIVRRARRGESLQPFLHRPLTRNPKYNDALLNEWGIHHFHLGGLTPESDGYMPRSNELLFAFASGDDLYLLDVRNHGAFLDEDLLNVLHTNWPRVIRHWRADGFPPPTSPITVEQRRTLRSKGAQAMTPTKDGTMYFPPGGGYMSNGLSARVLSYSDALLDHVRHLEDGCEERLDWMVETIRKKVPAFASIGELHLKLEFDRNGQPAAIIETKSAHRFALV